jgi:hypothetical protein
MKALAIFFTSAIVLSACEADLQVYTDDFKPEPVVYCLINPIDTIHYIRLSKTIDASVSPDTRKNDPVSLLCPEADITVKLISHAGDTIICQADHVEDCHKDPGYFGDGTHSLYSFSQVMDRKGVSLFKEILMIIDIPGYPEIRGNTDILLRPRVRFPHVNAQYLFVDPQRPLLVQWYGAAWNEVDIQFSVMEQYRDSTVSRSFSFQESTNIIMLAGVCEIHFPYEAFINVMARSLDPRKQVIRRFMGPVMIQVHTGNNDFAFYMHTLEGINDFSGNIISNFDNALGFLGCKLSFRWDSLFWDYFTRIRFADDPALAKFKFKEY